VVNPVLKITVQAARDVCRYAAEFGCHSRKPSADAGRVRAAAGRRVTMGWAFGVRRAPRLQWMGSGHYGRKLAVRPTRARGFFEAVAVRLAGETVLGDGSVSRVCAAG
jgi:hypothetical protein